MLTASCILHVWYMIDIRKAEIAVTGHNSQKPADQNQHSIFRFSKVQVKC